MATSRYSKEKVKLDISVKKTKKKKEKESGIEKVLQRLCALCNHDCGGVLNVFYQDAEEPDPGFTRSLEQKIINRFGSLSLSGNPIKIRKGETSSTSTAERTPDLTFTVVRSPDLCISDYGLVYPTETMVLTIPSHVPFCKVRDFMKPHDCPPLAKLPENYVLNESIGIESNTVQFKFLKDENSNGVTLSHRIVNKNNKLKIHVAAFANGYGGYVYIGINDDGTVSGERVSKNEKKRIIQKITEAIGELLWPQEHARGDEQGKKPWDITFVPVIDAKRNHIPSTFVIVVSVAYCPGLVFVSEPESYHIVDGKCKRMENVKEFLRGGEKRCVNHVDSISSPPKRVKWSSEDAKTSYTQKTMITERFRKCGEWESFDEELELPVNKSDVDNNLIQTFQKSVHTVFKGQPRDAEVLFQRFSSRRIQSRNRDIFEADEIYLKLVLYQANEETRSPKTLSHCVEHGLQIVNAVEPCVPTAWLCCEMALALSSRIINVSSHRTSRADDSDAVQDLLRQAFRCTSLAIDHSTRVENEEVSCDIQVRARVIQIMLHLSSCLRNGAIDVNDCVTGKDQLNKANANLSDVRRLFKERIPYPYNQCLRSLAECDYWYRVSQQDQKRSKECIDKAISCAKDAQDRAKGNQFDHFACYARNRLNYLEGGDEGKVH